MDEKERRKEFKKELTKKQYMKSMLNKIDEIQGMWQTLCNEYNVDGQILNICVDSTGDFKNIFAFDSNDNYIIKVVENE